MDKPHSLKWNIRHWILQSNTSKCPHVNMVVLAGLIFSYWGGTGTSGKFQFCLNKVVNPVGCTVGVHWGDRIASVPDRNHNPHALHVSPQGSNFSCKGPDSMLGFTAHNRLCGNYWTRLFRCLKQPWTTHKGTSMVVYQQCNWNFIAFPMSGRLYFIFTFKNVKIILG